MKVAVIVNPIAGASRQHSSLRAMLGRLSAMGIRVEILATRCAGDGSNLARQATTSTDYIIAVGGDGTVREVVAGVAGSTVPMMIWPTGTENLAAKSLGFTARVDVIPQCITAGRTVAIDLGTANGQHFIVVAGASFDAEVVNRLVACRAGHITHLTYVAPIWRTFWTHRWPRMRVWHNEQLWWEGRGMIFVGNIWRYSLGLPVVRDAKADDGQLDLLILPCRNQVQLLAHAARIVLGRHVEHGDARYLRFTGCVRVEAAEKAPFELDGDCGGWLPAEFKVLPRALSVRLPPG